jgi:hypothetical protein
MQERSYDSLNHLMSANEKDPDRENNKMIDYTQFILFEKNKDLKEDAFYRLPAKTKNPYTILSKCILWELMDLEAMLEAIKSKSETFK